jgi:exopolysaccharide biosynthesis polyprenyl glycosylphosphotransferase
MSSQRSYLHQQVFFLATLDAFCLLGGVVIGMEIRMGGEAMGAYFLETLPGWVYIVMAIQASNYVTGAYGLELKSSRFNMMVNWAFSMTVAILVVSITSYAWFSAVLGRGVLLLALAVYSVLWLMIRLLIYHYFFKQDVLAYRVAILGVGARARTDLALVQNVNLRPRHKVVAMIQMEQAQAASPIRVSATEEKVAGSPSVIHCAPSHVAATVRSLACDVLLVAVDRDEELAGIYAQLRRLRFEGVSVLSPLNVSEVYGGKVPLNLVDEHWLMNASQGFISPMTMRFKRMMDVGLVLLVSPLALVLTALVALVVKLTEIRAPVFYSQERTGRFGRVFRIHKFRTMKEGAEAEQGAVWSIENDPRVTWAGRSLRKYRLDEIPQLWNILKGEMSLVGPRPERPELVEKLEKLIPYYRERENIPPGLTGWAQIRYPYGATMEDSRAKLEFDLYYLQNLSIALDIRIILRTLRIVLFGMEREIR